MSSSQYEIRPGAYYDSVVLMQLQRALAGLPGVSDAGVVMATAANRSLLAAAGFALADVAAGPDDLLIAVKAESEAAASDALAQVDDLLKQRRTSTGQDFRPRSLATAAAALPAAAWVLVSTPGRYAAGVAQEALRLGKHVFLYSDNVPLADEIALKGLARQRGLLVMGPDCGTAIINGVGLGFANRVRRGAIGLVAASGTGLQAIASRIHNLGAGVSQAIGVGGRDLHAEVGGVTAGQGLDLLSRDPATDVIVLVSKPPAAAVAASLLSAAQAAGKPVVVNFIGYALAVRRLGNLHFAVGLDEAASVAVALAGGAEDQRVGRSEGQRGGGAEGAGRYLRGLFSGGTLAVEALLGLQAVLHPLYSNVPLRPEQELADSLASQGHTILDLGEDEFTQGRLHPMMDNDLRLRRLRQEAADPAVGLILLDVVLGQGAHPDPAGELAPAIAQVKARRPDLDVVALVVGTAADPQGLEAQIDALQQAGAAICDSVSEAVAYVGRRLGRPAPYAHPPISLAPFQDGLSAINVGLEAFYHSLIDQGAEAVQVDWRPPAGGNEQLMAILARLKSKE